MAALPNPPLISVEEYLTTAYDPDVEYVDGVLVARGVGDWLHALIQSNVLFALRKKYPHLKVVAELRSSVTATRYRLPDVCVLLSAPTTRYLLDAAFIVVEILSEGDVMSVVVEKLREYAAKGVQNVWVIDPRLRLMWSYSGHTLVEVETDLISTTDGSVELSHDEIFAE
jgi:Uma2 family endonuclease